jgi:hypothetical protein
MLGGARGFASIWPLTRCRPQSAIVPPPALRPGVCLVPRWWRAARGQEQLTEPCCFSMREPYGERMVVAHPLDRQGNSIAAPADKVVRQGRRQVRSHENAPVAPRAIPAFACVQRQLMLPAHQRCDLRVGRNEAVGRGVGASKYLASSHRCSLLACLCPSPGPCGAPPGRVTPGFGRRSHTPPEVITLVCAPWENPGTMTPLVIWAPQSRGVGAHGTAKPRTNSETGARKGSTERQHGKAARKGACRAQKWRGSPRQPRRRLPRRPPAAATHSAGSRRHPRHTGR